MVLAQALWFQTKTIIDMFFLISFVKHVIPGNNFWHQGHSLNKVGRCPIPNIKTLGIEDASMISKYKPVKSLLRPFLYFTTYRYAWKFFFFANLVIYFDFSCFPYIILRKTCDPQYGQFIYPWGII